MSKRGEIAEFEVVVAQVEGDASWWVFRPSASLKDDWTSAAGHWYYAADELEVVQLQAAKVMEHEGDRAFVKRERGVITRDGVFRGKISLRYLSRNRDLEHCAVMVAADVEAVEEDYAQALVKSKEYEAMRKRELEADREAAKVSARADTLVDTEDADDMPLAVPASEVNGYFVLGAALVPALKAVSPALVIAQIVGDRVVRVYAEGRPGTRVFHETTEPIGAASRLVFQTMGVEVPADSVSALPSPFHPEGALVALSESASTEARQVSNSTGARPKHSKAGSSAKLAELAVTKQADRPQPRPKKAHRPESNNADDQPTKADVAPTPTPTSHARCCGLQCWTPATLPPKDFVPGAVVSDPATTSAPVSCVEPGVFITGSTKVEATPDAADGAAPTAALPSDDYLADLLDCIQSSK